MAEDKPKAVVAIRDFKGVNLESDEHDLAPEAAAIQTNCSSDDTGVLKSRVGFKVVVFEDE